MPAPDQIPEFKKGDPLKASNVNDIANLAKAGYSITGPDLIRTPTGVHIRARRAHDTVHWGKLDADLAYNNTTGVTFSIWELNASNAWADTDINVPNVLPPFELAHAMVPSGVKVKIEQRGGKWYVAEFPKHYQGVLAGALAAAGTATVTVGSDSFTGCKALEVQTDTIATSSDVRITLHSDGYYYVDLAPC